MSPTQPSGSPAGELVPPPIASEPAGRGVARRARSGGRSIGERLAPYLFLLPALIGVVIVTGGAILASFAISFTDWDLIGAPHWTGLGNYRSMISSHLFWVTLRNTFYYVLLYVPLCVAGSLMLALLANAKLRGILFFRGLYFFPAVTSMIAVAIVWAWLYNPEFGLINYLLKQIFGIDGPRWLLSTRWAMPAIVLMSAWKGLGYNMLIFLAGLQAIPPTLHEAATIDGAGAWTRFWRITLPMLSPTTFFVVVVTAIGGFQLFEQTYVLTQGGPANSTLTLSYFIYQNAFQFFRMGYATALAYVLFAATFIITFIQFRLQRRWVHYG